MSPSLPFILFSPKDITASFSYLSSHHLCTTFKLIKHDKLLTSTFLSIFFPLLAPHALKIIPSYAFFLVSTQMYEKNQQNNFWNDVKTYQKSKTSYRIMNQTLFYMLLLFGCASSNMNSI